MAYTPPTAADVRLALVHVTNLVTGNGWTANTEVTASLAALEHAVTICELNERGRAMRAGETDPAETFRRPRQ